MMIYLTNPADDLRTGLLLSYAISRNDGRNLGPSANFYP
jgi:hypothetical protein